MSTHRFIKFYVVGEKMETAQLHPKTFGFDFVPRKDDVLILGTDRYKVTLVELDYEECIVKVFGKKVVSWPTTE